MSGVYLDTSALGRVVLDEPDRGPIISVLDGYEKVVSSRLLRIEIHRLGLRAGIAADELDRSLTRVALVPIDETILSSAESVGPPTVATLDAIHLVTAVRLATEGDLDAIMTFDRQLADGAREHGLAVVAPGLP
jgi:predicted nucleic acid-binding protein